MFEQIRYEVWTHWCPIVGFLISFTVFVAYLWHAWHIPPDKARHMANLPLEETSTTVKPGEVNHGNS